MHRKIPNELLIRAAIADDTDQLLEMVSALADHHGDRAQIAASDLARDALGDHPWVQVLVCELRGRLIGYAALLPLMQLQFSKRGMDLHHLFVAADYRGNGIGRALINAAKDLARNHLCSYLVVGTDPGNTDAQAAYLACGFQPVNCFPPRFRIGLD